MAGFRIEVKVWYWLGDGSFGLQSSPRAGAPGSKACRAEHLLSGKTGPPPSQRWHIHSSFLCKCYLKGEVEKGQEQEGSSNGYGSKKRSQLITSAVLRSMSVLCALLPYSYCSDKMWPQGPCTLPIIVHVPRRRPDVLALGMGVKKALVLSNC